jgi:bacillithiol biosynthesis deacetylase BshB1
MNIYMKKLNILAFAAHPDDTELSCAGTLAALVKQGLEVGVVDLTRGEMGSRGTPQLRLKEAKQAAEIIGLSARVNLGLPDTELKNIRENHLPIIQSIRQYRPHICIITAPEDRHPDHGHATKLLIDAIFYSGLVKIETRNKDRQLQEPHRPAHVLHYMQDTPFDPDFIYDISDTIGIKEKAIKAFSSQFNVADPGNEPETYISDPAFFEALRARAKQMGHLGGFEYGEGFLYQKKPFPVKDFSFLMSTNPKR